MRGALALAALCLAGLAEPALAQGLGGEGWTGRVRAGFSVGAQLDTTRLSQDGSLTEYLEPAPFTAESPQGAVPWFDGGVAIRLFGNVGAGVSVSYLGGTSTAAIEADIPHPFYFGQPRAIAGEKSGIRHRELATHVNAVYVVASDRIDLSLSGGVSFFSVEQSFVTDILYAEAYPYDSATYVDATLTHEQESGAGYNVGADVTWKFSPAWGVGGLIRFSRASVAYDVEGQDVGSIDVGGLQVGAGVRVMF
jgi:hypothetical protein